MAQPNPPPAHVRGWGGDNSSSGRLEPGRGRSGGRSGRGGNTRGRDGYGGGRGRAHGDPGRGNAGRGDGRGRAHGDPGRGNAGRGDARGKGHVDGGRGGRGWGQADGGRGRGYGDGGSGGRGLGQVDGGGRVGGMTEGAGWGGGRGSGRGVWGRGGSDTGRGTHCGDAGARWGGGDGGDGGTRWGGGRNGGGRSGYGEAPRGTSAGGLGWSGGDGGRGSGRAGKSMERRVHCESLSGHAGGASFSHGNPHHRGSVDEMAHTLPGGAVVGTCLTMCPERERLFREREGLLHRFELADPTANPRPKHGPLPLADPLLCVKEFKRAAADQAAQTPESLRPIGVLTATLDHLLRVVIGTHGLSMETYPFCFDRMRAIRKDIVYQDLHCAATRQLLLRCLGFTALASAVFAGAEGFEAHLNLTATKEALQSLVFMCHDEPDCAEAAIVTIANAIYFLGEERPFAAVRTLAPNEAGGAAGWATELLEAHTAGNFVRFFRLANDPPSWLLAALLHRHLASARASAIIVLHEAYATKPGALFSLVDLARFVGLPDAGAAARLCTSLGMSLDDSGGCVVMRKSQLPRLVHGADGSDAHGVPCYEDVHPVLVAAATGRGAADVGTPDLNVAMGALKLNA